MTEYPDTSAPCAAEAFERFGRLAPVNPNVSFKDAPDSGGFEADEWIVLACGVEVGRIRRARDTIPWLGSAGGTVRLLGFELLDLAGKPVVWAGDWLSIEALAYDFARSELCAVALAQARREIAEAAQ